MRLPDKEKLADPEGLMRAYKKNGDLTVRNQLVMHYAAAVKSTLYSMRSILPANIQPEEWFNQGILTLMDCIEKYDPDRGASFGTYIFKRLRGAMLSYMRKQSWLPYRVRLARREIQKGRAELENQLMREATAQELADHLGMAAKELDRYLVEIGSADMLSFEELIGVGPQAGDPGAAEAQAVDQELLKDELKQALAEAIDQLSPKEKQVIALCYYENLNLREIGEVLGVSQQRISFIRAGALTKLNQRLSNYLYGRDEG
ncbi:MAG: FliA/WhiG family RNA polymerase sigma factor [Peptococcaceae bacterium]|jgi:RNA polymerase sigma factor for flagellar operon FliA|nr:FliA/WhiG family RNA polymerase sigma factor [Peptococcaceae bacterium]